MTREAARAGATRRRGSATEDVDVIELHDCFSRQRADHLRGARPAPTRARATSSSTRRRTTYGGAAGSSTRRGGLISKGHPLGATGLAQCARAHLAAARRRPTRARSRAPSVGAAAQHRPRRRRRRDRVPSSRVTDDEISFDERGLVPCVIQDWRTGEVLTLAYMNAEALERTRETGELHLWSRSRDELWHKGATSRQHAGRQGAALRLRRRRACSRSSSRPARPATPASARASTTATLEPPAPHEALPGARAHARRSAAASAPTGSYTADAAGRPAARSARRCSEEAEEVARAAREESDERVAEEAADVLYHLAVLLRGRGLEPRRRRGGARWPPSPLSRNARPGHRDASSTDCETPVSAFLKLRGDRPGVPARVGRAGPARRALVVHRLPPARRSCAGRSRDGGDPYALAAEAGRRATARRRCDGLPPFAGGAVGFFGYDSCARSSRCGEPEPRRRSGCPTWR